MLKGFRDFILRGNVLDLAVAVLIGAAFGQITSALTQDIITPFISAVVGTPDFSHLKFHMHVFHFSQAALAAAAAKPCIATATQPCHLPGDIYYGVFVNAVINFLIISAAIYFLIVLPVHRLMARVSKTKPSAPTTKTCPQCLSEIPIGATRCKFCGEPVPPAEPAPEPAAS